MTAKFSIIGGYLGAGKSTMINALLRGGLPGRTAVIVNDFGSVNIDTDLIASAEGDTIALTNGCICCQISTEMIDTISALAARGDLEHIVCEVSGVGDPGQMARWRNYPGLTPGPIVVCVDATTARRLTRDAYVGDVVRQQTSSAEAILLTKVDLATDAEVADAVAVCNDLAPSADIHLNDVDDLTATLAAPVSTTGQSAPAHTTNSAVLGTAPHSSAGGHADVHRSITVRCAEPVDPLALTAGLEQQTGRLVRAKGTVRGPDGVWREIHLASGRVDVADRSSPGRPEAGSSLVLIAAGPDAEAELHRAVRGLAAFVQVPASTESAP
ncbi:GTP-binding protein [Brevibacterium sp. R8603A2]|uniref:CobW family GTP-binding protein n=1 Tax=Brevibacterium sp. R8603A2 TaxID=2929779 RepID=UPI001FF75200|nr:GTP-binding protein [Brevibacterium sp. R8603A2]